MAKRVVARVNIDDSLWRWVKAHALLTGVTSGELVEKMILDTKKQVEHEQLKRAVEYQSGRTVEKPEGR